MKFTPVQIFKMFKPFFKFKSYLKDYSKDISISRIFPMEYFADLILRSNLVFVKPHLWDDPLESHFLKKSEREIRWNGTNLYGICWTEQKDIDHLWEKYCPDGVGVRVYSNLQYIDEAIIGMNWLYKAKDRYSGNVRYLSKKTVRGYIESDFVSKSNTGSDTAYMRAHCLFYKSRKYRWEQEVRIVFENQKSMTLPDPIYRVPIDLQKVIQKIEIDPRATDDEKEKITQLLKEKALFSKL